VEVAGSNPARGNLKKGKIMEEEKLAEGTFVVSSSDSGMITGVISGIATTQMPGIGYMYIIKIEARTGKAWDNYPYSCCVLPRSMFMVAGATSEIPSVMDDPKSLLKSLLKAWDAGDVANWFDHHGKRLREICG
jgi:hypothetical protein